MPSFHLGFFAIVFLCCACNNSKPNTPIEKVNVNIDTVIKPLAQKPKQHSPIKIPDSIQRWVVDDYPISENMFGKQGHNGIITEKYSGQTIAHDQVWFKNNALKQIIIFELYTDDHRMVTFHFYSNEPPTELLERMELHAANGEFATEQQKRKDFGGFVKQANAINANYFTSNKEFKLGDTKQKALRIYGKPTKITLHKGIEKLEWAFIGDIMYDGSILRKGQRMAFNSFGHQATLYFKNGKLIGLILHNDIP
jgi:hypothetical protein